MGQRITAADMPACPGCGMRPSGIHLHAFTCQCGKRLQHTINAAGTPGVNVIHTNAKPNLLGSLPGRLEAVPAGF